MKSRCKLRICSFSQGAEVVFLTTSSCTVNAVRLTEPHAFGPKKKYFGHKILMKQPHDCSYY